MAIVLHFYVDQQSTKSNMFVKGLSPRHVCQRVFSQIVFVSGFSPESCLSMGSLPNRVCQWVFSQIMFVNGFSPESCLSMGFLPNHVCQWVFSQIVFVNGFSPKSCLSMGFLPNPPSHSLQELPAEFWAWDQYSVFKDHHVDSHYFQEEVGNIEREANNKNGILSARP